MNYRMRTLRVAGTAAIAAAALLALTVNVSRPSPGGPVRMVLVAEAHAFDPVKFVWEKFRSGVLDKVLGFIKSPIEKAKRGLKSLIDKAVSGLKKLFQEKVLGPAMKWALTKIFPNAEKFMKYVEQALGKVEMLMNTADKYAAALDAMILKNAERFQTAIGEVDSSMDIIQRFNVSMIVDILIQVAKEKAEPFIKAKTTELLSAAYKVIEGPINIGKTAAVAALGSIPIVGGIISGAADFIITQGLKLLRSKGFEFVAQKAVELANQVIDTIGKKLKGVAGRVDTAIAPVLDAVKGFIAKAASFVAPIKNAFAKVKAGFREAQKTMATLKAGAEKLSE